MGTSVLSQPLEQRIVDRVEANDIDEPNEFREQFDDRKVHAGVVL